MGDGFQYYPERQESRFAYGAGLRVFYIDDVRCRGIGDLFEDGAPIATYAGDDNMENFHSALKATRMCLDNLVTMVNAKAAHMIVTSPPA